ncbi:YozE family protein [Streptomyces sp. NPDC087440]|uniref:YozE family protein n=1 Tax=Streptomyces sp. NPDC087440 TaxID=3365790 RepID=UPI0037F64A20
MNRTWSSFGGWLAAYAADEQSPVGDLARHAAEHPGWPWDEPESDHLFQAHLEEVGAEEPLLDALDEAWPQYVADRTYR